MYYYDIMLLRVLQLEAGLNNNLQTHVHFYVYIRVERFSLFYW